MKSLIRNLYFRQGSIRTIQFGPMRGMTFRVNSVTGLSPWYSGAERPHQRAFKQIVWPGDVVIDVGANWGLHSLYLSRLVGPQGTVMAVEPFPLALSELKWHLEVNHCLNVRVISSALSDKEGTSLFVSGASASTGKLVSVEIEHSPLIEKETFSVLTQSLDSLLKELQVNSLKLVKIDVEGAESKVLLGAQETIQRFQPYFVIDLHNTEQDLFAAQFFTQRSYQLKRLQDPPILRVDRGRPHPDGIWGSVVACPPEKL